MRDLLFYRRFHKTLSIIDTIINKNDKKINVDYFLFDNMMNITFNNEKKIIITSQVYLHQLWIATSTQGYHLIYNNFTWICIRTKKNIDNILKKEFFIQTNCNIDFILLKKIK
ncbi:Iron-sulfur cluster assembly protein CyaY [Buchnera aphidicola (Cinara kochiana kochiana)]|uniref:Iron-sulfur cluster assembly protein CyaY n=1 Tax=Buchnera aphidicola (Cinara kochiana kochiana) TaxID=2518976 RepID=A0A451D655_9GAMM|nr:iron donor protein CyaY [Buchnera aphidicola]VFP81286.1 Iron-sulfur cluster assembly protein CyaY [Buchnera aphidicola (Cinara kochiana kochiana)]